MNAEAAPRHSDGTRGAGNMEQSRQARESWHQDREAWALVLGDSRAGWPLRQNLRLSGERQGRGSYSLLQPLL